MPGREAPAEWQVTAYAYAQYLIEGGEIPDMKVANCAMDLARQEQSQVMSLKMRDDPQGHFRTANLGKLFAKYMKQLVMKPR